MYHARFTTVPEGADVTIRELPIIHLFVPDPLAGLDGARGLIAAKLDVDASSFDLVIEETRSN